MNEGMNDYTDRIRNLAIAAVQIATLCMIAQHMGWDLGERVRELRQRYRKWIRQQEFELFFSAVWPIVKAGRAMAGDSHATVSYGDSASLPSLIGEGTATLYLEPRE